MYSHSKCCVKDNYNRSEFFNYDKGVRQGCILSPLLFNLYLNELPYILNNNAKDPILLPDGSHLNCLLYADDLLLISHSAEGLQQSLDRLSKYCQDWLLKINPTKAKVIVFQKKSRKSTTDKYDFSVSNEHIEIVNNYTYLGVNFSANGNFTNHKENLKEKTKRSFFDTRKSKLFHTLFSPILTYCSEVWGIYDKCYHSSWEKDPIEKIHIHFCKMCLGLNKRPPNVASRNELGTLSLKLQITMSILKFWIHLENQPPDSIAKLCLNISDKMAQENKSGLINEINLLCAQLNINKKSVNFKKPSAFLSKAENNLSVHLKKHQVNLISTNKKLKFYSIFKNETRYSEFINHVKNPEHKRIASKFRIGNHNLRIESGRFTIPKTPEDLRICDHCSLNSVENEMHVLFHCNLYDDLRKILFTKIKLFTNYNNHVKVCFLSNNTDSYISRPTATFTFQAFERRKKNHNNYTIQLHLFFLFHYS